MCYLRAALRFLGRIFRFRYRDKGEFAVPSEPISAHVNPLAFLEVDEPWASHLGVEVTPERVLKYLCVPGISPDLDEVISRYKLVSVEEPRLIAVPVEARLLDRMIWPLRNAKGSYMVGNYLGTISLCGMVAEMAAILRFDLGNITVNGKPISDAEQKNLFGSTFEKLGQERRVNVLKSYGLVDEKTAVAYGQIRAKRRRYLHFWTESHASLESDAVDCFTAAVTIVVSTLGLGVENGRLRLRQEVLDYVREHNAAETPGETETDE